LRGENTEFLPFNKDIENPVDERGFKVAYLYRDILEPDSILDLIENFIHKVEEDDDESFVVFPRYHQLDTVRRVMDLVHEQGAGENYLIQHSAGSGKTYTISWLAHELMDAHDEDDERIFDTVVVVSDRLVINKQLKRAVQQFEQTPGVVMTTEHSDDLKQGLETGKNIIVTTIQKFPYALEQMEQVEGNKFAVLIDEAHSGQGGVTAQKMNKTLQYDSLEEAEDSEEDEETIEEEIVRDIKQKQRTTDNISYLAFTATPKKETLELFGHKNEQGEYEPFSLYSMRQAIEEGFILDVLENYIAYKNYFELAKNISHDPEYESRKAKPQLVRYANLEKDAIQKKTEIMLDHFAKHTKHQIGGKGKAMLVTRSRLHVVKYKQEFDRQLRERDDIDTKAIAAFSGTVVDDGIEHTETSLNDFPANEIKDKFNTDEYRIMLAANKFQTGFDQPLLETMWVDKNLSGVNAVQTLSRLNRDHQNKDSVAVLDFINDPGKIQDAFQPYYETMILSEETDPNVLYEFERKIKSAGVIDMADVEDFMEVWFRSEGQDALHRALAPAVRRYNKLDSEDKSHFRNVLRKFIKQYEFILQIVEFQDDDLHKLYLYSKMLIKKLPVDKQSLPKEITENVELDKYALNKQFEGTIDLMDKPEQVEADTSVPGQGKSQEEETDPLSEIIRDINEVFGGEVFEDEEHAKEKMESMADKLKDNEDLMETIESNPKEDSKLKFEDKFADMMSDMYEKDFGFYQKLEENKTVKDKIKSWLFNQLAG
ncbi:MAG: type I restriction endonuclease subunit R, partial [Candidatus Magasanikbacteria bacterium]